MLTAIQQRIVFSKLNHFINIESKFPDSEIKEETKTPPPSPKSLESATTLDSCFESFVNSPFNQSNINTPNKGGITPNDGYLTPKEEIIIDEYLQELVQFGRKFMKNELYMKKTNKFW